MKEQELLELIKNAKSPVLKKDLEAKLKALKEHKTVNK